MRSNFKTKVRSDSNVLNTILNGSVTPCGSRCFMNPADGSFLGKLSSTGLTSLHSLLKSTVNTKDAKTLRALHNYITDESLSKPVSKSKCKVYSIFTGKQLA